PRSGLAHRSFLKSKGAPPAFAGVGWLEPNLSRFPRSRAALGFAQTYSNEPEKVPRLDRRGVTEKSNECIQGQRVKKRVSRVRASMAGGATSPIKLWWTVVPQSPWAGETPAQRPRARRE